jgi:Thrombospondin type 1 domain
MPDTDHAHTGLRAKFLFKSNKPSWLFFGLCAIVGLVIAAVSGWAIWTFALKKDPRTSADSDCAYNEWSPWMGCETGTPSECGDGVGIRFRGIKTEAAGLGTQCDAGALVEEQACLVMNATACQLNACSYSDWSEWLPSTCPATSCVSDTGNACAPPMTQARSRTIVHEPPPNSGTPCDPMALFDYQQCTVTTACTPVDCVPEEWSDVWSECSKDACVPQGSPAPPVQLQYQTRGVAVQASGGGKDCLPDDFVQSRPCPSDVQGSNECEGCTVTAWSDWSTCDAPCSTSAQSSMQWRVATAVINPNNAWCNETQVQECTTPVVAPVCPLGAFDAHPGMQGTLALSTPVPAPGSTRFEILALCAETPTCAGVSFDTTSNITTMLSEASTSLVANATCTVYTWNATSDNCIQPTWAMLDAECLNLCSGGTITERGRVYAFDANMPDNLTPMLSCPITTALLQTPGLTGCAPNPTAPDTWVCQASQNCEYTPWQDSGPWSQCSAPCGAGGGTRIRRRGIAQQPTFLGAPCETHELEQEVVCNVPGLGTAWNAVPQMACIGTSLTMLTPGVEGCAAAATAAGFPAFSFASADTLNAAASQQMFYAMNVAYEPRNTTDGIIATAAANGFKDWRYAGMDELIVAQGHGAQWCANSFLAGSGGDAWFPMQEFISGCGPGSGVVNAGSSQVAGGAFVGTKPNQQQATTLSTIDNIDVYPFAYSISGGTIAFAWDAPTSAFTDICMGHGPIDVELKNGQCGAAVSTLSLAADFSCAPAIDCSLSNWVDYSACPSCGPPYWKWQTREYVAGPINGGAACNTFLTQQSVTCNPAPPSCQALEGATVYGEWPSIQALGPAPCQAVVGTAYTNAWDTAVQAAWILDGSYNALNSYNGSTNEALPQDLADALNTQCLGQGGVPPSQVITSLGNTFSLETIGGTMTWATGTTAPPTQPDPVFQACVVSRAAGGANTKLMFSPSANAYACPSTCPYDMAACSFTECSANCAGGPGSQFMTRPMLQSGNGDPMKAAAQQLWTQDCVGGPLLPGCKPASCPIGPDGSPCSSASGHGTCGDDAICTCTDNAYAAPACWFGLPADSSGDVCSGHGTSSANGDGTCACDAGWASFDCSVRTQPIVYHFVDVTSQAANASYDPGIDLLACHNDWTKCNRCDDMSPDHMMHAATLASKFASNVSVTIDTSYLKINNVSCDNLGFSTQIGLDSDYYHFNANETAFQGACNLAGTNISYNVQRNCSAAVNAAALGPFTSNMSTGAPTQCPDNTLAIFSTPNAYTCESAHDFVFNEDQASVGPFVAQQYTNTCDNIIPPPGMSLIVQPNMKCYAIKNNKWVFSLDSNVPNQPNRYTIYGLNASNAGYGNNGTVFSDPTTLWMNPPAAP